MKSKIPPLKKLISIPFLLTMVLAISVFFISANFLENSGSNFSTNVISPEWNQFQSVSLQDSSIQGVPWTGEPGITLTVDQLMAQESILPKAHYPVIKSKGNPDIDEGKYPEIPADPNSLDVSQWPPRNPDQKNIEQNQTDNPQTVGANFLGIVVSESGYIPPDTQGDVGPTQVMICANGRLKVFSKTGVVGGLNIDMDLFFVSVRNGQATGDCHIRYDRLSARWFVVAFNFGAPNRLLIAMSSGPTITNSSSFTFFQFQQDLVGTPGADLGAFADYPTLGVDKFALYIGCNMFTSGGSYIGTSAWVVNKTNLIANTLTVTGFHGISSGSVEGPRTPQGVDNDDPSATQGYFIGVSNFSYSRLTIRRVTNPGGTPSLSGNLNISVPTTGPSINVPALGTFPPYLDGIDDRLYAAEIHKNKITGTITLWTSHHTQVNSSGVYNAGGGRLGSRWYEITNLTSTPSLVQSGTLFDPVVSNPKSYFMPSCAMSGQGHMAIAATGAGAADYAKVYGAGRLRTDALGTIQSATLMQSSTTSYNLWDGSRVRWGDYSQTVVDPTDDQTMWTFQEYCNATDSWGVRAIQLKAPPPATPSSSSVVNIDAGQSSVNIVITGTSVSGSEFFDPGADAGGPGFANHINASISGTVTVNNKTFNSPTQVTLNISTVGSPVGLKNITITNPDGQTATGNNLINIQANSNDVLNLTSLIQGFYDPATNLMVRDTMRVYVRNATAPYAVIDSGKVFLTNTGTGAITFTKTFNSVNYYLEFRHRNSIATWSKSPGQSFTSYALTYDLSSAAAQAFGSNQKQVDTSPVKFAVYGGDSDKDGSIDAADVSNTENAATNNLSGYVQTDYTGDDYVDGSDLSIVENNAAASVAVVTP